MPEIFGLSYTRENAASVLRKLGVPAQFDLLCLDIDQNTYYAWEGLAEFCPRVVVVEYNAVILPGLDWKARYVPRAYLGWFAQFLREPEGV